MHNSILCIDKEGVAKWNMFKYKKRKMNWPGTCDYNTLQRKNIRLYNLILIT